MVFMLSLLALTAAPTRAPKDIVECFLSMPVQFTSGGEAMPLEEKQRALADKKTVIDKANGYLSFSTSWVESGQSLEPITLQLAIFMRQDKTFIVGITNSSGDYLEQSVDGLRFYEYSDEAWSPAYVVPNFELKDFWISKTKPSDPKVKLVLRFNLPIKGTTIGVTLVPTVHGDFDDGLQEVTTPEKAAQNAALAAAASLNIRPISLVWSSKKGEFTKKH